MVESKDHATLCKVRRRKVKREEVPEFEEIGLSCALLDSN